MYICICKAKTEDDIKREGVDTLAGTGCGTCLPYVNALLDEQSKVNGPLVEPSTKPSPSED